MIELTLKPYGPKVLVNPSRVETVHPVRTKEGVGNGTRITFSDTINGNSNILDVVEDYKEVRLHFQSWDYRRETKDG